MPKSTVLCKCCTAASSSVAEACMLRLHPAALLLQQYNANTYPLPLAPSVGSGTIAPM